MNETMRAISQDRLGGPDVLHVVDIPRPKPGPSQILVRVHAAGLNPTDWKHRSLPGMFLGDPPFVLGWDVSGVVEAVGLGVTLFKPGDEVFGMLPYPHGVGATAEYVTGPTRAFVPKPERIDHVTAGAIPLAALTAWQALVDTADVQPGQRVLVHAAAGGVGHFAVQIAKARGAYVIGTASEAKHELVRGLGADEMIDYRAVDFAEHVRDVDAVLDTRGGDYSLRSLRVIRPGGVVVTIVPRGQEEFVAEATRLGARVEVLLVEADHAGMAAVAELIEAGQLRPVIEQVFAFEDAASAHAAGDSGHTTGKLVLDLS